MIQASVRDRLLDAALALFVAEGYDSVSVDRVRKTAAVSNGSFFHLFQSKADLAAELLISCVLTYQRHVVAALRGTTENGWPGWLEPNSIGVTVRTWSSRAANACWKASLVTSRGMNRRGCSVSGLLLMKS